MQGSKRQCRNCPALSYCLSQSLSPDELEAFERLAGGRRVLRRGQRLFVQGESFHSLHIVQSGSVKTYVISEDGNQQITGFHYRGDLLGMDGLASGRQICTVEALETSSICEFLLVDFEAVAARLQALAKPFVTAMARELAGTRQRMLVLGKLLAEQRLAHFLLDTAEQLKACGLAHTEFILPMTRQDIANYLGLAVETVSRLLTRFDNADLVRVQNRQVCLINTPGLSALLHDHDEALMAFRLKLSRQWRLA